MFILSKVVKKYLFTIQPLVKSSWCTHVLSGQNVVRSVVQHIRCAATCMKQDVRKVQTPPRVHRFGLYWLFHSRTYFSANAHSRDNTCMWYGVADAVVCSAMVCSVQCSVVQCSVQCCSVAGVVVVLRGESRVSSQVLPTLNREHLVCPIAHSM